HCVCSKLDGFYILGMRCLIALLLTVLIVAPKVEANTLPDKFLGTFKLERDENFDEYLKARGYGWLIRQVIELASVTKKFSKAASGKPGLYDMENLTTEKDTHYKDWTLGKEFQEEALDSTQHKITFDLKDPDTLTEKHIKVDDPTDVEIYEYRRDGDYLVMRLTWSGVTAVRYYKKQ
uniref:Cytosolic fatty-acid binding proteins domain-containing protein n=1 Tax=Parascaris univalens TaxID=6257 RepID=A0A915ASU6_PARUN